MKFITQTSQVTIRLEGVEKVWALKRRLQIPRYAISDMVYEPDMPVVQDFNGHLRVVGTALPWSFVAGTYRKGDEREFWYVRLKQPGVLTIELKRGTLTYDRIRVTCEDDFADILMRWWRTATVPSGTA